MRNQDPHNQIEARLIILILGLTMALGGKMLWINIMGWVFVTFVVLCLLGDIYKAIRAKS